MGEGCAALAAILWFVSAQIRFKEQSVVRRGLAGGADDPKAFLRMLYEQSRLERMGGRRSGLCSSLRHTGRIAPQHIIRLGVLPPHAVAKPRILRLPRDPSLAIFC